MSPQIGSGFLNSRVSPNVSPFGNSRFTVRIRLICKIERRFKDCSILTDPSTMIILKVVLN
jgi:hypothetical protein